MTEGSPRIGVLALQGDFAEHAASLEPYGIAARKVRRAEDLADLDGLVLPGGESTTMLKLLDVEGLWEPLAQTLRSGIPVLATCAGTILLAEHVENPEQRSFGLLPIRVVRNGYGRQICSGTVPLRGDGVPEGTTGTFIRAPRITAVGPGCEVLAWRDTATGSDPVLVRKGPLLASCFHPELQAGHPVTAAFASTVRAAHNPSATC